VERRDGKVRHGEQGGGERKHLQLLPLLSVGPAVSGHERQSTHPYRHEEEN
jgi:hypothetical protein